MTNLANRPTSPRGDRRREQLVDAGLGLLSEGGWPSVTTRGVAERAGTNPGLIHYHFGGLPGLRVAIARRAAELVIEPFVAEFLRAHDETAALAVVRRMLAETRTDERTIRLAVEVIAGAARDPMLGEVLRDQLRRARASIAEHLHQHSPGHPPERLTGAATVIVALVDGLMLHYLLDADLPTDDALAVVGDIVQAREGARGEERE